MKLKPRKIAEAVAEKILMASGYLTSIVIVLIVVFLFREGAGLFDSPAVEQGYVLAVNRANPVQSLTPEQIMQIFDADLTNWSEVGGPDDSILVFRLDDITSYATEQELGADLSRAPQCLSRIVADHPNMIAYLPEQYVAPDFAGKVLGEGRITPASFFAGRQWYPTAAPAPQYGLIPLLAGTLWVSLAAILIALPLGLSVAIYMAELADSRLRRMLKPVIELLAGIPSVVYGVWGTLIIVPWIADKLGPRFVDYTSGYTVLASGIVLGIMILPILVSLLIEIFTIVPQDYREASASLGATKWQTCSKVILRKAMPGIVAAVVLSISKAFGETIAVLMVCGNYAAIPRSLFDPCYPLPALIANNYGEMLSLPLYESALMFAAFILFFIILVFNIISRWILRNIERSYKM